MLLRISATGGEVTPVTTLDSPRQELFHRISTFLPDDHHFLYSIQSGQMAALVTGGANVAGVKK